MSREQERERLQMLRQVMQASQTGSTSGSDRVALERPVVAELLQTAFGGLVDERWYLKRYPDVADAIRKGAVKSARDHYFRAGIFEGRVPYEIGIDSSAYLEKHQDVAKAVSQGTYRSGRDHFLTSGFAEGRDFALKTGVLRRSRA